jgi:hypothetical protein
VRRKLGEVVETIGDIHVSEQKENVVVNIPTEKAVSPAVTDVIRKRA